MPTTIRLSPVVQTDIPTLGRLFGEAFDSDSLRSSIFVHGADLDLSIKNNTTRLERDFASTKRFLKAVDEKSNEIVGYITWSIVENQQDEKDLKFEKPLNVDFNKAVFGGLQRRRVEAMRGRTYIHFNTLAVRPDRQRQGIADLLMRHFVTVADREGLDTYLTSQVVAHRIYQRFGWRDVNTFETDLEKWGSSQKLGTHKVMCVLRPPQPLR